MLMCSLSGCFAGLAGTVLVGFEAAEGSGGTTNTPSVSLLDIRNTKRSPADVTYELHHASSRTQVELVVEIPGEECSRVPIQNPPPLSNDGKTYTWKWDFTGLVPECPITRGVRVAILLDKEEESSPRHVDLGNEPPKVAVGDPVPHQPGDVTTAVYVDFTVTDPSKEELVRVRVDYVTADGRGGVATQQGMSGTPGFHFEVTTADGEPRHLTFSWDVAADLPGHEQVGEELEVQLRFTPWETDEDGREGKTDTTDWFRVDTNDLPVAELDDSAVRVNPDHRRRVAVPFTVADPDGDDVLVAFQWRRGADEFPELPHERSKMEALLDNPTERRKYQIATESPLAVEGRAVPLGGAKVRLPEILTGGAESLDGRLVGRELEILGPSGPPSPVREKWQSPTAVDLRSPVAALPAAGGTSAFVLDRPSPGKWRLRELDLTRGRELRVLVPSALGNPTAMAHDEGQRSALIALELNQVWWVVRVYVKVGARIAVQVDPGLGEQIEGDWSVVARATDSTPLGPVRGIVSLGSEMALITVGDAIVRLDLAETSGATGEGTARTLLSGLASPWGLVADPLRKSRVYVAERDWGDLGRVVALDLDTLVVTSLAAAEGALPRPESIALERSGTRLLAVTDSGSDGDHELRGLDLRAGEGTSFEIAAGLGGPVGTLAVGPDRLRLLALTSLDDLAVAGGVAERRLIVGQTARDEAVVDRDFDLPLTGSRWRIFDRAEQLIAPPSGTRDIFLWDTSDVGAGEVVLRAVPFDSERGPASEPSSRHRIASPLEVEPVFLHGGVPAGVAAGDVDGDGDLDLAVASEGRDEEGGAVRVYLQRRPGEFGHAVDPCAGREPDWVLSPTGNPYALALADLDGDGKLDLVSADRDADHLTVCWGTFEREGFGSSATPLGGEKTTNGPEAVLAADLDADGLVDLVTANLAGDDLAVFFQKGPRVFEAAPPLGADQTPGEPYDGPVDVAAGDLDSDGRLDLVAASGERNDLMLFFQAEPGLFGRATPSERRAPDLLLSRPETMKPRAVAVADLDGDGDHDLVSANFAGGNWTVFFQQPPDASGQPETRWREPPLTLGGLELTPGARAVAVGDLDADGDADVVGSSIRASEVSLFGQSQPGEFGKSGRSGIRESDLVIGGRDTTRDPRAVVVEDLDRDGDQDLVVSAMNGVTVFLVESPGKVGNATCPDAFESEPSLALASILGNPEAAAAADLDGDGDLDLVAAIGSALTAFPQEAPGVFANEEWPLVTFGGDSRIVALAAAELDRRGARDLVVADAGEDCLRVLFQEDPTDNGRPGSFEELVLRDDQARRPTAVAIADLNADGDPDVVSANLDSANLAIFYGKGLGAFGDAGGADRVLELPGVTADSNSSGSAGITAADVDGDGRLDLVVAHPGAQSLAVFYAEFAFEATTVGDEGGLVKPTSVAASDVDGDGALDLVAADFEGALRIFLQESPRKFRASEGALVLLDDSGQTLGPRSVTAGDLNGDGDVDLIAANDRGNNLAVFFQTGPGKFAARPDLILKGRPEGPITKGPVQILAVDVDGDGDEDVVSVNSRADGAAILPGNLAVFYNTH